MAEKHIKGDKTQTTNGDIPVVAPLNMGKTLKFEGKEYNVNVGDTLQITEEGVVEIKLSKKSGNLIQFEKDGIYYGIQPKANKANLYVDVINGVDQDPDVVSGAGSRSKPLKTFHYAARLADAGTRRNIYLREGQEHIVSRSVEVAQIKSGELFVFPYGDITDGLIAQHIYPATAYQKLNEMGLEPKLVLKGFSKTAQATLGTTNFFVGCIGIELGAKLSIDGVSLINDVTDEMNSETPKSELVQYSRIVNNGEFYFTRGKLLFRGVTTGNAQFVAELVDDKNLHLIGFIYGSSMTSTLYSVSNELSELGCYIFTKNGWSSVMNTATVINHGVLSADNQREMAKRTYFKQLDTLPSGDKLIKVPTTNIANQHWM